MANRFQYPWVPDFETVNLRLLTGDLATIPLPEGAALMWNRIEQAMEPGEILWDREVHVDTFYNAYQLSMIRAQLGEREPRRRPTEVDLIVFEHLNGMVASVDGYVRVIGI